MILILSTQEDESTNTVIDWLDYYNLDFIRINENTPLYINKIIISNTNKLEIQLIINNKKIDLNSIKAFWYRRGEININTETICSNYNSINENLFFEKITIRDFIHKFLKDRSIRINSFDDIKINKLVVLDIAQELGLNIPSTIISEKREILRDFCSNKCITKPISDTFNIHSGNDIFKCYTSNIETKNFSIYNETLFPTLLQEKIDKKYELRIFFLHDEFYSMAIFSQENYHTRVDFRKYNKNIHVRRIPYILPEKIKSKLKILMNRLELVSGSIDIIVDSNNQYWFLEVNPIGQFGMVSEPCNYNLYDKIAKYLGNV